MRKKSRLVVTVLPSHLAAIEAVVPPQIMCLPSFEKNRLIILEQSSLLAGGPNRIFIGSLFRIFTTHEVASSPGLPPYSLSHSSVSIVARFFAVYSPGIIASINSAISSRFQPKLYAVPIPA